MRSSAVDTSMVVVNATWSRGGQPIPAHGDSRVTAGSLLQLPGSNNSFVSSLQFDPLDDESDSGVYSCSVSVTPAMAANHFIEGTSVSQSMTITVLSESNRGTTLHAIYIM